jgi:ribosome-binding factor A
MISGSNFESRWDAGGFATGVPSREERNSLGVPNQTTEAAVNQRIERVQSEIREILGEIMSRQEIKDPRVAGAGIITITHVRVTGDLGQVNAQFMVHGADEAALEKVQEGLNSAAGYMRRVIGKRLKLRITPALTFHIDRIFEQEEKVDALLRDISTRK